MKKVALFLIIPILLCMLITDAKAADVSASAPQQNSAVSPPAPQEAPAVPEMKSPEPQPVNQAPKPETRTEGSKSAGEENPSAENSAEGPSGQEEFMSGKVPSAVSTKVRQFGYNLFRKPPSSFAPVESVPVSPEYVIGPGDEIKVSTWGMFEYQHSATVDRDGTLSLPKVGRIGVAGLTFKEIQDVIHKEFSKNFTGFEMNVSMGRLRTIRVFVVGNVSNPGAYTISSLSTLINAIFEAGGPNRKGSMRDIQVKRNGRTIVHFDMYDFLLKGDKTRDVRLMPEDIIFVPPVGPLALIAGEVRVPAIYELKGETRITDLIAMAGGVNATGYLGKVTVEKIFQNEVKTIIDANLKDLGAEKNINLEDGSIVKIFPISDIVINAVTLSGNVTRPGQFQWSQGLRVSDIIKNPEKDLLPESYFDIAIIKRRSPPDFHEEIISFNLGKALTEKGGSEDVELQPYDTVEVYYKWDFEEKPVVRVTGAVNKPGSYELRPGLKISDLLNLAGGLKYYASRYSELTRVKPTEEGPSIKRMPIDLDKAMELDPANNILLARNDYLFVRNVPEWELYRTVTLTGEVRYPGVYTIKKGETISSLLERAGGVTEDAYLEGAVFNRVSVRESQQKSINDLIGKMEQQLLFGSAQAIEGSLTPEQAQQEKAAAEMRRAFIAKLKMVKATGRMVIALSVPPEFNGGPYDIPLEDGDSLSIPEKPNHVEVVGAVNNQTAIIYDSKKSIGDYIESAGGMTPDADAPSIYILKANGMAVSRSAKGSFFNVSYDSTQHRWTSGSFSSQRPGPGDTIVVPEETEKVYWLREVKDVTQILFQVALSAGVVIAAF